MKSVLKAAGVVIAATIGLAATGAQAQVTGVKTIVITNANPPAAGIADPAAYANAANLKYIQIGDVSSLQAGSFKNVAHAINGATATASSVYDTTPNGFGGQVSGASNAIDETYSNHYVGAGGTTPGIFHSSNADNEFLQIDLADVSDLRNLSIIARGDGLGARDYFQYQLFGADGINSTPLKTGFIDSRLLQNSDKTNGAVNLVSFVPEPATWAMLILGFGVIGGAMRRRKAVASPAFA